MQSLFGRQSWKVYAIHTKLKTVVVSPCMFEKTRIQEQIHSRELPYVANNHISPSQDSGEQKNNPP